jgi:hypothetical protein
VNLENSTCSRATDRDCIHQSIRDTVGFAKLTRMVFDVLDEWIIGKLRFHISIVARELEVKSNEMLWCHFSNVLAIVLSQQGRHADAALIEEGVIQHLKRRLQAHASDDTLQKMLRNCVGILAAEYGFAGRLAEAAALQDDVVRISLQFSQEKEQGAWCARPKRCFRLIDALEQLMRSAIRA